MFQNPDWIWLEVLVIIAIALFLVAVIGTYIYKRIHHMPTGDCECCHSNTKRLLKQYRKKYSKQ